MTIIKANLIMLLATLVWGSSYIFTKMGLGSLEEFNLIALRFLIAFVIASAIFYKRMININRKLIAYAFILGLSLFSMFAALTFGVKHTTASNAGFLISLTVIFVPILSSFILRKVPEKKVCFAAVVALIGIGLLTLNSELRLNLGDFLCILAALLYAIHMIITGTLTKEVDSLALGIWQLGFTGALGLLFSIILETPQIPQTLSSWGAVLALSILCSAFGFVAQTVSQKYITPTNTGLIFSLEPVFAAIFAFMFFNEVLTSKGYVGAALVLLGVLSAEIDLKGYLSKEWGQSRLSKAHNY